MSVDLEALEKHSRAIAGVLTQAEETLIAEVRALRAERDSRKAVSVVRGYKRLMHEIDLIDSLESAKERARSYAREWRKLDDEIKPLRAERDALESNETHWIGQVDALRARVFLLETHLRRVLEIGDFMATGTTKELFDRWDQAASDAEGVLK